MRVHVAFTPDEAASAQLGIVVDVLRATSTIAQALASGYERVYCCREIDEARALRERARRGPARRRAERGPDRGLRRRRLAAGVPRRAACRDGDLLDDERDARDPRDGGALPTRCCSGACSTSTPSRAAARERGEDVTIVCAGFQGAVRARRRLLRRPDRPAARRRAVGLGEGRGGDRARLAGCARGAPRPHVRPARPRGGHRVLRPGERARRRPAAEPHGRRRRGDHRGRLTASAQLGNVRTVPVSTVHVRYMVDDVEAAIAFYTTHFGFERLDRLRARVRRRAARQPPAAPQRADELGRAARCRTDDSREPGGWNRIHFSSTTSRPRWSGCARPGSRSATTSSRAPVARRSCVDDPAGNPIELFQPR